MTTLVPHLRKGGGRCVRRGSLRGSYKWAQGRIYGKTVFFTENDVYGKNLGRGGSWEKEGPIGTSDGGTL